MTEKDDELIELSVFIEGGENSGGWR